MNEISGTYFLLDNKLIPSKSFDALFLKKGLNVYEVLRFVDLDPFFFEEHYTRFITSIKGKKIHYNESLGSLLEKVRKLITANKVGLGNIKIVLHAENNLNTSTYIYQTPHHYPSEKDYLSGVKLVSYMEARPDPNYKTWRPLFKEKVLALKKKNNAFDILLVDNGIVREGGQSNFFAIIDSKILTARGEKVLKGITREIIFRICKEKNIVIEEADFSLADLDQAEAVFLTGTSPGIIAISQIDNFSFSPTHPILNILTTQYNKIINQHNK